MSFRTDGAHAAVATQLRHAGDVKLNDSTGVRVGHVRAVETRGPFAVIHAQVRKDADLTGPVAHVKRLAAKGPATYVIRRIMVSSSFSARR